MPHGDDERGKPEEPTSEAVERPWATNDKLTYDSVLSYVKSMLGTSEEGGRSGLRTSLLGEMAILEALGLQEKLNTAYATHVTDMNSQKVENNRFTLDRLYGVFPEEGTGIAIMVQAVVAALKETGWKPATPTS